MIDFHIHTNNSDGEFSPYEVIMKAKGLEYLAITDHDTLDGHKNIGHPDLIRGIEMSCDDADSKKIHIVGLGIDVDNPKLNKVLDKISQKHDNTAKKYIKLFNKEGFDISFKELKETYPAGLLRKPHFAKFFLAKGYIQYEDEIYEKYFRRSDFKFKKPRTAFDPHVAIKLIHNAGGVAILAHPQELNCDFEAKIKELKTYALDGMEVYHSGMTKDDNKYFHDLAVKYDLLESVGSDFHGPHVYQNEKSEIGKGIDGNIICSKEVYQKLLERLKLI